MAAIVFIFSGSIDSITSGSSSWPTSMSCSAIMAARLPCLTEASGSLLPGKDPGIRGAGHRLGAAVLLAQFQDECHAVKHAGALALLANDVGDLAHYDVGHLRAQRGRELKLILAEHHPRVRGGVEQVEDLLDAHAGALQAHEVGEPWVRSVGVLLGKHGV